MGPGEIPERCSERIYNDDIDMNVRKCTCDIYGVIAIISLGECWHSIVHTCRVSNMASVVRTRPPHLPLTSLSPSYSLQKLVALVLTLRAHSSLMAPPCSRPVLDATSHFPRWLSASPRLHQHPHHHSSASPHSRCAIVYFPPRSS